MSTQTGNTINLPFSMYAPKVRGQANAYQKCHFVILNTGGGGGIQFLRTY